MSSFAFNKLPVELQLLVWQYAIADIDQVIAGDLDLSTTTLSLRGQNIDHANDYLRLLSIRHLSRQEVLRSPPVFMVEHPTLPYLSDADSAGCLAIKHWHFGGVFTDILLDIAHLVGHTHGPAKKDPGPDLVGKTLLFLFGPTIRRVHVWGGDQWHSFPTPTTPPHESHLSSATGMPVPTTFRDADALHFLIAEPGHTPVSELRETLRQRIHGERSQNIARPDTFNIYFGGPYLIQRETLVDLVTPMGSYLPDLEYVSLMSWRNVSA